MTTQTYRDATIPDEVIEILRAWIEDRPVAMFEVRGAVRDVVIRWDENVDTEVVA